MLKRLSKTQYYLILFLLINLAFCVHAADIIIYDDYTAPKLKDNDPDPDVYNGAGSRGPFADSFKAYKDEKITFWAKYQDEDSKSVNGSGHVPYFANKTEFRQLWKVSGKATLNDPSEGGETLVQDWFDGAEQENVHVYIASDFGSGDTITVKVWLVDTYYKKNACSDAKDSNVLHTWTITVRDKCPEKLVVVSPSPYTSEYDLGQEYVLQYDNNTPVQSADRPAFDGISVTEEWGDVTSNLTIEDHVKPDALTAEPTLTTDQDWRNYFFDINPPAWIGTFTPDDQDKIKDQIAGFAFKSSANQSYIKSTLGSDLYKQQTQTFKCNSSSGNLSQSYIIKRIIKASNKAYKVTRTDP